MGASHEPSEPAGALAVSVVVPIHNEAENIAPLLEELAEQPWVQALGDDFEVLCVDDASTDDSLDRLRAWLDRVPWLRVLAMPAPCVGKTRPLLVGLSHARGRHVVTMDGDRQNDPADIPRMLDALESADIVGGTRGRRRRGPFRRLMSVIGNRLRNFALKERLRDAGCGLKAMRREVADVFPPLEGVHRFLLSVARIHGYRVAEVTVNDRQRVAGKAKYGIGRMFYTWRDLLAIRWYRQRYRKLDAPTVFAPGGSAVSASAPGVAPTEPAPTGASPVPASPTPAAEAR